MSRKIKNTLAENKIRALKDTPIEKALTCIKFTCINKNGIFDKEIDTFGYFVALGIYTLHTD